MPLVRSFFHAAKVLCLRIHLKLKIKKIKLYNVDYIKFNNHFIINCLGCQITIIIKR